MSLFGRRRKNENSRGYRLQKAMSYDNKLVQYVTERTQDGEVVIGKGGSVSVRGGEVIVLASQQIVFRAPAEGLEMSDLLSGNGAILRGVDTVSGRERTLVVHFSYYRK